MRDFFKQSEAQIGTKDFPALFREMANDLEQCLAEGDQAALVGCLAAISMVFQLQLAPAINAQVKKIMEGQK